MDIEERPINPQWLVIARQSRGFTQKELAARLSVNQGWLSRVESGLRGISGAKLLELADLLDYPAEFFLQQEPVHIRSTTNLFHRKRQDVPDKVLDRIYAQIVILTTALQRLLEGVDIAGTNIKQIDMEEFDGTVEDIARQVRREWGLLRGPVQNLTKAIESASGIVIPFDFGTRRIDAMSLWPLRKPPLFFINVASPGDRLRFTLCHELGHIIMHQQDLREGMEREADQFAAEFLMPMREIVPYLHDLSLPKLAYLKIKWKVSMAALLNRASCLGAITPRRARTLWMEIGKSGYRTREPEELDIPIEAPNLYREIVDVYQQDMHYSLAELGNMVHLSENEVRRTLVDPPQYELTQAVLDEAEQIIRETRQRD